MHDIHNRPMACKPYTSYRCQGNYGWIMIGAMNDAEAFCEALRSSPNAKRETLQVWRNGKYEAVA